jgi:hypothetical protein
MREKGITASNLHLRNDKHQIFYDNSSLPILDNFYNRLVHIPVGWWVDSNTRKVIVDAVNRW